MMHVTRLSCASRTASNSSALSCIIAQHAQAMLLQIPYCIRVLPFVLHEDILWLSKASPNLEILSCQPLLSQPHIQQRPIRLHVQFSSANQAHLRGGIVLVSMLLRGYQRHQHNCRRHPPRLQCLHLLRRGHQHLPLSQPLRRAHHHPPRNQQSSQSPNRSGSTTSRTSPSQHGSALVSRWVAWW